jgi:hypothetical protein
MSFVAATIGALAELIAACGGVWQIAFVAVVLAGACESAKPAQDAPERGAFGFIGGVAALVAPFFLLVHVFKVIAPRPPKDADPGLISALSLIPSEVLAALGVVAVVLLFAPSLIGWAISRSAPDLGATFFRASPLLNAAALAFAIYATYRNVALVLDWAMAGGAL